MTCHCFSYRMPDLLVFSPLGHGLCLTSNGANTRSYKCSEPHCEDVCSVHAVAPGVLTALQAAGSGSPSMSAHFSCLCSPPFSASPPSFHLHISAGCCHLHSQVQHLALSAQRGHEVAESESYHHQLSPRQQLLLLLMRSTRQHHQCSSGWGSARPCPFTCLPTLCTAPFSSLPCFFPTFPIFSLLGYNRRKWQCSGDKVQPLVSSYNLKT